MTRKARPEVNSELSSEPRHPECPPVLLLVGTYPPEVCGIGDYTAHLARELVGLGAPVTVLSRGYDSPRRERSSTGVDVCRTIDNWNSSEAGRVLQLLDELGPETIVHIQYGGPGMRRRPMISGLPAYLRRRRPGCRLVLTLHEYRALRLRARALILPMIFASHGIICVDPPDREHLSRGVSRLTRSLVECIPIAPNILPVPVDGALRARWRTAMGFASSETVVLYFGSIEPLKGFSDLVAAVHALRERGLPLQVLIVGSFAPASAWFEPHIERARRALESGRREGWVVTRPHLPPEQVSQCLHSADVALFPYLRGARSNRGSLLAAIAHQLPVVTTDGPQTSPGFADEFGVALAPSGDADALRDRLREVIESDSLRQHMRLRMAEVRERFSWSAIAQQTLAFYRRLSPTASLRSPR